MLAAEPVHLKFRESGKGAGTDTSAFESLISPIVRRYSQRARGAVHASVISRENLTVPFHDLYERRSEEHTSELQSLMRISYAVFCLKKKNKHKNHLHT